jgi:uncharacterized protein YceH (UPF0502 family)
VLGVLIEKAKTTPAGYPMSVNSIVTGCNQKNNRDPITAYDDIDVEKALDQLRTLGVVTEVDWMGRVSKYKHGAYEWFAVNRAELAVLTELLLRGAQQAGELRARAARMEAIPDLAALKPIVDSLLARGLMIELTPAGRGQVLTHGLYLPEELAGVRAAGSASARDTPAHDTGAVEGAAQVAVARATRSPEDIAALAREVAELRAEVAGLGERVRELEERDR